MAADAELPELFLHEHFYGRKKFATFTGASMHLRTPDDRLLGFSRQKAFKLKEDIRVYADEEKTQELLSIKADSVIDFSAAYRVTDATTGRVVGSLRRKGWSSLLRDSWEILDASGNVRGRITEDSSWMALVRRLIDFAALLFPQSFVVEVDGRVVATMKQTHNIFAPRLIVDLSPDPDALPRPLAVAAVVLLLAIEGRQG